MEKCITQQEKWLKNGFKSINMANQFFNVNTDAVISFTAKLERLNRQGFPNAVRSTLSDGAFEMKKKNILFSAKKNMTVRSPSFFKKFTGVDKAKGYEINSMKAKVGFINTDKDPKKGQKAIVGMEHNEVGGSDSTGAMYLGKTRHNNSLRRKVRLNARYDKKNLARGHQFSVRNSKNRGGQSTVMALMASYEEQKPVFIRPKSGIAYVVKVLSAFNMKEGKREFKLEFLMRSRKKKTAHAKATHFNKEAAIKTSKQMDVFYVKNAEREFNKALKKTI